jgi:hypothetical protein
MLAIVAALIEAGNAAELPTGAIAGQLLRLKDELQAVLSAL